MEEVTSTNLSVNDMGPIGRLARLFTATQRKHIDRNLYILIDDLGYPKENIDIEVIIQRGANRNAEEADIVVYRSADHRQENAYIVIEIETPKKTYDVQALSYITATTAPYSVWYAGMEKNSKGPFYHYRDMAEDPNKFYGNTNVTKIWRKRKKLLVNTEKVILNQQGFETYV